MKGFVQFGNRSVVLRVSCLFFILFIAGCASTKKHHPDDPFESFNRASYAFNHELDRFVLKPVSTVYDTVTPAPVKNGLLNVFANMGEVPIMANDLLQAHPIYALSDAWRFFINSTVGLGGIFDVASHMKLHRRYNDFGLTLAKWGVKHSPYLVIPFVGSSTFRDGLGLLVNLRYLTLWPLIEPTALRNSLFALDIISLRATLLDAENLMDQAALDPYVFIRSVYLQKRASLIAQDDAFPKTKDGLGADLMDYDDLDYALGEDSDADMDTKKSEVKFKPKAEIKTKVKVKAEANIQAINVVDLMNIKTLTDIENMATIARND